MDALELRDAGTQVMAWALDYLRAVDQRHVDSAITPGPGTNLAVERGPGGRRAVPHHFGGVRAGRLARRHAPEPQQAMLWSTSPAANQLEQVVLDWLRQLLALPERFAGVCRDGGSSSNLHAVAAALAAAVPDFRSRGLAGRSGFPRPCVYASAHAHASVAKAAVLLGLGLDALRAVPGDNIFRMAPPALAAQIASDRLAGWMPIAVVATAGTTSTGSIDPVAALADICAREGLWLHVDASVVPQPSSRRRLRDWSEESGRSDPPVPGVWIIRREHRHEGDGCRPDFDLGRQNVQQIPLERVAMVR